MEPKLVSVIIPTYNRAEYLKQAIESVLAQTYTHFELLILDNCSPDHTPDVVARFSDPRIKYLRHACNIRGAANWSYGIYWAKGEYLCVLGDDDWYTPEFISSHVDAFTKYENIVAVFSNYDLYYQNDSNNNLISKPVYSQEKVFSGSKLIKIAVSHGWFLGATLYKRDIVVDLLEQSIMAGKAGDNSLNINIALTPYSKVVRICNKGLVYRIHSQQDSMQNERIVWIGHIAACTLPLQFEEHKEYKRELEIGADRVYNIIGRQTWDYGQKKMAARYFKHQLILNPFDLITWLRYLRCYLPFCKV
jgi:glycosyltransferase involved in cell wall biosynthesis